MRFSVRFTLFVGLLVVGLYYVIDPATPKLYRLLVALGLLGFLLYFFLGDGGGGKGDGFRNKEDHEVEWEDGFRRRQFPEPSEHSESFDAADGD